MLQLPVVKLVLVVQLIENLADWRERKVLEQAWHFTAKGIEACVVQYTVTECHRQPWLVGVELGWMDVYQC